MHSLKVYEFDPLLFNYYELHQRVNLIMYLEFDSLPCNFMHQIILLSSLSNGVNQLVIHSILKLCPMGDVTT